MCEGCGLKHSSFGLPDDGKRRWFGACAKSQAGAKCLASRNKKCEDCKQKLPSFGVKAPAGDGKRRWCGACAKSHANLVCLSNHTMCEGCKTKHPSFGVKVTGDDKGKILWLMIYLISLLHLGAYRRAQADHTRHTSLQARSGGASSAPRRRPTSPRKMSSG